MIRNSDDHSIPELKKLWKVCFEDEDAYIHDFFAALYNEQDVLLAEENGVLMGASFFLPGKLQDADEPDSWQEIRYVYALAVYPQYRGRGIAGKLLEQAYRTYGAPLIAEPANEGLVGGFYEPRGFEKAFYLEKEQADLPHGYGVQAAEICAMHAHVSDAGQTERNKLLQPERTQPEQERLKQSQPEQERSKQIQTEQERSKQIQTEQERSKQIQTEQKRSKQSWFGRIQPADAISYARIRDARFAKRGYVKWPAGHVAFAIQQHRAGGGDALIVTDGEKEDLLLYYIEDGTAVVTETTLSAAEAAQLLRSYIPEEFMPQTVTAWKPFLNKNDTYENKDLYRLTGMIYGRTPVRGYLNLSLD